MLLSMSRRVPLVLAGLLSLTSQAQPIAGLDLIEIRPPQPTTDPERIVVTEFFSYQCPHCNSFDPALRRWVGALRDDVLFERVAVSIGRPSWVPIARAFYTLEAVGELERLDAAIFRAIHVEGARLYDKESVLAWMKTQGIDGGEFSETYDSFGIDTFVRRAEQVSSAHKVFSIPALSLDGKYLVPIVDDGTFERQLAGVGELIERLRAEKQAR